MIGEVIERLRERIPPRWRTPLRLAAYPVFALLVAAVTFWITLPRDRIKDRVEELLSANATGPQPGLGLDVSIGELGLSLLTGAGLQLEDVVLRSRPINPADKPARYVVDDADLRVGLLGLAFDRPTWRFEGHGLKGEVEGRYDQATSGSRLRVEVKGLVLDGVQGIQASVGLPVGGTVTGRLDVTTLKNLLANASGEVELSIDHAVIGDGKAKLKIPGDPFLRQGITFPKLRLGRVAGRIVIEKGKARFDGIRASSADGEVTLDGFVTLRDPLAASQISAYLKFKPSESLTKREPTVELLSNALLMAKRPDGYLGFRMSGSLSSVFFLPSKEPPVGVTLSKAAPAPPPPGPPPAPARPAVPLPPPPPPSVAVPPGEPVAPPPPVAPPAEADPPPAEADPAADEAAPAAEAPAAAAPPLPVSPPLGVRAGSIRKAVEAATKAGEEAAE